jgi:hypothetical protein
MPADEKPKTVEDDDKQQKPGTDAGRDKTLTEKEEEEAGGSNRQTPGPIYDV